MEIIAGHRLRPYWVFLMRGILLIAAGVYIVAPRAAVYLALGFMFGLIILLAGIAELFHAVHNHRAGNREWYFLLGLFDLILGVLLTNEIAAGVIVLRILVGVWLVLKSVSLLGLPALHGESATVIAGGVLAVICAVLILFSQSLGYLAVILWTVIAFIRIFNVLLEFR